MKPVTVLGGLGYFGSAAAARLRSLGVPVRVASRRAGADIHIDAEDPASIRRNLGAGDLVLDAAGPFQRRSMASLEAAVEMGFDVVDLNDDLRYAQNVLAMKQRIDLSGIRVLSSASSISAVSAAAVRETGITAPVRVRGFIVPASRDTANAASALSLLACVGRPVGVLRGGRLEALLGWRERRPFGMPHPVGPVWGRLVESADAVNLPQIWPTLTDVETYIDAHTPGLNRVLDVAAVSPILRRLLEKQVRLGTWVTRSIGASTSGLGYEVEDAHGDTVRLALVAETGGFAAATAPAILAIQAIAESSFPARGLVLPHRQVEPPVLFAFLESVGIRMTRLD